MHHRLQDAFERHAAGPSWGSELTYNMTSNPVMTPLKRTVWVAIYGWAVEQESNPLIPRPDRPWWNHPWAVALGPGLVLLVIGLFLNDLARRTLALAIAALLIVAGLGWAAFRVRRAYEAWRLWQAAINHKVLWLHDQLQLHVLGDALTDADAQGWDVGLIGNAQGISLTAPNGKRIRVEPDLMLEHALAERLHFAAPEHFPDRWRSSIVRELVEHVRDLNNLDKRLDEVEVGVQRLRNAPGAGRRLSEALAEAGNEHRVQEMHELASQLGWKIERNDAQYVFTRGKEQVVAPLNMEPKMIIDRLRQRDR